jgi:ribose transport system substrate-binding protein
MRIVFTTALTALLSVSIVFFSCGRNTEESTGEKISLAFVAGAATDFWSFAQRGSEKADKELPDVDVEFRFTSDGTASEQRRVIEDLLVRGIDGLAVTPLDPINQKPMVDRLSRQIPVVITDSDVPGSGRLCYLGTDNVEAGREAGKLIKEVLPDGGKIMLFVGKRDAQNAVERIQGIQEELADTQITIIDIRTDEIDRVRAKSNAIDTLVKYPDISCLVGLWNYNGPMILAAVKDADKLGQVKIVCFDEEEDTLNGVRDGYIYGTVVQQPFEFGYQSIYLLAEIVRGDMSSIPENKKIIIPTQIINRENVEAFIDQVNILRQEIQ